LHSFDELKSLRKNVAQQKVLSLKLAWRELRRMKIIRLHSPHTALPNINFKIFVKIQPSRSDQNLILYIFHTAVLKVKVKVKQSRYRPGVAQRVPGS
jgi:hypothetical protein